MVGSTTHQQQQSSQFPPQSSSSSTAPTTTPEKDELVKRNTDCVYFLASPLTCKKGSECEYRHSETARVNPRDCYYWLNGNCLNPKCAFRHSPLDGLLGADVATPVGPQVPLPHPAPYAAIPKQGVACIFFQKGFCLKGHLCPFIHAPPNSINNNKSTQSAPSNPIPDPPKTTQRLTVPVKQTPLPVDKKPTRVVPPPVMNEPKPNRNVYHGYHVSEKKDRILNEKEPGELEFSREPSPGFDVLVDNVDQGDRDMYREHRDYDRYNEKDDRFYVDHVDHLERRPKYPRNDRENGSDLRNRISKQREYLPSRDSHHRRPDRRLDQGNLGSRLRGRIKIPTNGNNNSRVEREIDTERKHLSRYSPGRPLSLNQSRLRDRITGHRDMMTDNDGSKFPGPKRLSELKSVGAEKPNDEQSLGKRKYPKIEDDLSFEGPKPLSEILKRKRGINNNNNNNDINNNNNRDSSVNTEDNNQKERETANKEDDNSVLEGEKEKDKMVDGKSVKYDVSEAENEDVLVDEEVEGYDDERDGEYEYEEIEGEEEEDYNLDEGEYVDEEYGDGDGDEKKEFVE